MGTINKKILIAVLGGLIKFGGNLFTFHSNIKIDSHPALLGLNSGMGLSLSVIPFLFLKIKNRKINSLKASNKIQGPFTHKLEKGNKKKKKYLYILAIASLDFVQKFFSLFFREHFL